MSIFKTPIKKICEHADIIDQKQPYQRAHTHTSKGNPICFEFQAHTHSNSNRHNRLTDIEVPAPFCFHRQNPLIVQHISLTQSIDDSIAQLCSPRSVRRDFVDVKRLERIMGIGHKWNPCVQVIFASRKCTVSDAQSDVLNRECGH